MVFEHRKTAVGYAFDARLEHEFFARVVPRRRSARHSRLAQEGYITRLTHRGYRVSEMTAEEVESVFW
jgi:hypothetical protein